jgi:hypothetical protein
MALVSELLFEAVEWYLRRNTGRDAQQAYR